MIGLKSGKLELAGHRRYSEFLTPEIVFQRHHQKMIVREFVMRLWHPSWISVAPALAHQSEFAENCRAERFVRRHQLSQDLSVWHLGQVCQVKR